MSEKDRVTKEMLCQLTELIPGIYSLSARSLGMTIQDFNNAVIAGNLKLTEFIPCVKRQILEELDGQFLNKFSRVAAQELATFVEEPMQFIEQLHEPSS